MGRVAKYKKIKACDPFSKKNAGKQPMLGIWGLDDNGRRAKKRSATARNLKQRKLKKQNRGQEEEIFDLPPIGGDDFDLGDILRINRIEPPALDLLDETELATNTATVVPKSGSNVDKTTQGIAQDPMLEEKRANRLLKIKPDHPSNRIKKVERFPGESRKAFEKRFKSETRQLIRNEELQRRNPEKRQRKKEFLNKKKKMRGKSHNDSGDGDNDYRVGDVATLSTSDGFVTGEQAVARMMLGDQVERPPIFNQLPRGATVKVKKMTFKSSQNKNESIAAEQKAIENLRRKAQAQYALLKAKRRKAGDFHL